MVEEEEITTTAFRNATLLINHMWSNSENVTENSLIEYGYPASSNNVMVKIFTGNIRPQATSFGLSNSAAGDGMGLLNGMQCVTKIRHGSGKMESVYILHYIPTQDQYKAFRERQGKLVRRIAPSKFDTLLDDMAAMKLHVKALEQKISWLELRIDSLGKDPI